jgi:hypothetical protein
MTSDPMPDRPDHNHASLTEGAECPVCRAYAIALQGKGPHGFALAYYDPAESAESGGRCSCCGKPVAMDLDRPDALALIRSWAPTQDSAVETAWATGCNPGCGVAIMGPLPVEVIEAPALPLFTLIEGPAALAALDAIRAALPRPNRRERRRGGSHRPPRTK